MDILDLIEADGVKLTRQGKTFRGRCPFHDGKTETSLLVDAETGKFHCFGCDQHGDAIDWLRERRGLSFIESCKVLGRVRTGHDLHRRHGNHEKQSHPLCHGRTGQGLFLTGLLPGYGHAGVRKQKHGCATRRAFLMRLLRRLALDITRLIYTNHGQRGALKRHLKRTVRSAGNGYRRGLSFP